MTNKRFEANHINDLYLQIIRELIERPEYVVSPRGKEIKEITNATIILTNPINCLVSLSERKLNYAFAIIEKMEYASGESIPERLNFYNSNMATYSNDLGLYDGQYAERFHYWIPYVIELLKKDKDSRQAVIPIYGIQDRHISKDVPCTVMLQFMIRNSKLNCTVYMRSNDILWGFPYDVNGFCFIQQIIASLLNLELGTYTHVVGSLHLYIDKESQLQKILDNPHDTLMSNPSFPKTNSIDELYQQFKLFWSVEYSYRHISYERISGTLLYPFLEYLTILHHYATKHHHS